MKLEKQLQTKINNKTKPIGSLGFLEKIAYKIGKIQQTTTPALTKPAILVFAGDHGIVNSEPVSPYPQKVTAQMVYNFLNGGAAINVFCKQHHIDLKIIDAGINHDFTDAPNLINAKISKGTDDFSVRPAMSIDNCKKAIAKGKEIVTNQHKEGSNIIGFGEMGIGNTSSASLLMSAFTNIHINNCVGVGTGVCNDGLRVKKAILRKTQNLHQFVTDPIEILACYGGFEIAMITGAILKAKELNMVILIDGFIVTSALLVAKAIDPEITENCIFTHNSAEQGHEKMLYFLGADTILNIGLRLGEGTGVALAYPIIQSAVNFLNEMASFENASVSKRL